MIYKNKINFSVEAPRQVKKEGVVVIPFAQEKDIFSKHAFLYLPERMREFLKKTIPLVKIQKSHFFDTPDGSVMCVSMEKDITSRKWFVLIRTILQTLKTSKKSSAVIFLDDFYIADFSIFECARQIATNMVLSDFDFSREFKEIPKEGWHDIKKITLFAKDKKTQDAVKQGIIIGEETNRARYLSNLPGGEVTPATLISVAKEIAKFSKVKLIVLDEKKLKAEGAGGILGVARGSKEKPYLCALEYRSDPKLPEVHLVGKGVTFDTGGLHVKPGDSMNDMYLDMSGGASVLSAVALFARLQIPANIVALVPAVENMVSGESYRPGDILKTISGKTIEVGSPDAEGRIIVADAIDYGKKHFNPRAIIEFSTLTGAVMAALGTKASGLFTSDERLVPPLYSAAEKAGDYAWHLPLWDEYAEDIKSHVADIWNVGKSRYGGAMHGAQFLWEFAKPIPFVHFDIAPRMVTDGADGLQKGSLGYGVKLLFELFSNFGQFKKIIS